MDSYEPAGGLNSEIESLRIREYVPEDFRSVIRLWTVSGIHVGPSDTVEELERTRQRDPDLFLVAETHDGVVGVVLGRFDGRRGWIHHLAVDPSHRSHGIGGLLVRELEKRLSAKGCSKVNLHVLRSNEGVCAFYEALGYSRFDLIFMDKWLNPP